MAGMSIEHISDTARWVAVYRAMETERPDAIFRDPFARRLAGDRGQQIVDTLPRGRQTAWAMIVRTAVFDEIILETIERDRVDLVVNLAAGLDARPWRLAGLPAWLRWVDVDLPGILSYKTETLADERPHVRYEAVAADLADERERRPLFERLGTEGSNALVITEGLLLYLTPEQVGALAADIAAMPPARHWLVDIASPRLLEMLTRQWGKQTSAGNAEFKFAPAEGSAFFEPFGWREAEYRSNIEEAERLRRVMPMWWLWRILIRVSSARRREEARRMAGTLLLERVG
jgi:methyltransferase (TIGR00027 family)